MGIVRNLVVRFKNWYKDRVNNVVNNMNARELTDDVKLRDNSKGKRPLAGLAALVLMTTPVLGLTENSEVELTTETGIENQVKDMPLGEVTDEAVINMLATPTDEMSDEEQEITEYTMDTYFESCNNSKEGLSQLFKKSGISEKQWNDMLYFLRAERCTHIRDELVKKGIISENFWDSYDNCMMGFINLCDAAIKKGDSDKLINVLPEEYREDYEEAFDIFIRTAIKSPLGNGKITSEVTKGLSDLSNILFADGERGGKLPQVCLFFYCVLDTYGEYAVRQAKNQVTNPESEVYRFDKLSDSFSMNAESVGEEFLDSEAISVIFAGAKDK